MTGAVTGEAVGTVVVALGVVLKRARVRDIFTPDMPWQMQQRHYVHRSLAQREAPEALQRAHRQTGKQAERLLVRRASGETFQRPGVIHDLPVSVCGSMGRSVAEHAHNVTCPGSFC